MQDAPGADSRGKVDTGVLYRARSKESHDRVCKLLGSKAHGLPVHIGDGNSEKVCKIFGLNKCAFYPGPMVATS